MKARTSQTVRWKRLSFMNDTIDMIVVVGSRVAPWVEPSIECPFASPDCCC